MCTVVIEVGEAETRLLAVRDEDPLREWDALGEWWPDRPGVSGIRDRRAGGAWLAADPSSRRLAVLLNRADVLDLPEQSVVSRGSLALESVAGRPPSAPLPMHGFNLLEVSPGRARVLSWDGDELRELDVPPGVHMIAHTDLDDPGTARIARWLPEFRAHPMQDEDWPQSWIRLLATTAELDPADDRAIIRDNRPHGYPTQSLLYCTASVGAEGIDVRYHGLPSPAHWA
ncbi:NRDE family protein [Microbacterium panaciterrae]|uniref:Transport and Golgi organisation 2 n=1 Tax=Microbacterium panaciterrae TaxID=985759 RepID=A0ABP8P4Y7_9MICO